jgi:hypothetical protein
MVAYDQKPPKDSPFGDYGMDRSLATHEYLPTNATSLTTLPKISFTELQDYAKKALNSAREFYSKYERPAYIPIIEDSVNQNNPKGSHYFGQPWMPTEMPWPVYGEYETPMQFVLQLDLSSVPEEIKEKCGSEGILLFFHTDGSKTVYPAEDFDNRRMSHVCVISTSMPGGARPTPTELREQKPLYIGEWREVSEYPTSEDLQRFPGSDKFNYGSIESISEIAGDIGMKSNILGSDLIAKPDDIWVPFKCFSIDKLGGWPRWEQGIETPLDINGEEMEYIMQVGYQELLLPEDLKDEIDWPTWGRGHIFRSKADNSFVYTWACD